MRSAVSRVVRIRPVKPRFTSMRDAAGVVDVGVGHQHDVDVAGVEGEHGVVQLVAPLL